MPGGNYEEIGLIIDVKKQEDLIKLLEYLSKIETKFKETNGKEIATKIGIDITKAQANIDNLRKLVKKAFEEINEEVEAGRPGIFKSEKINKELTSFNKLTKNFIESLQNNIKDLDSKLIEIYRKSENLSKLQLQNLLTQTAKEDDAYNKKINHLDKIKVKEEELNQARSKYIFNPPSQEEFSKSGKNVRRETDLQSNLSRLKLREEAVLRPNIDKLKDNLSGLDVNFNNIKNGIPGLITQQETLNNLINEESQSLLRVTKFREKQQASLDILLKKEKDGNELSKSENIAKVTLQNNLISNLQAQEQHIQNLKALKSELIILDKQVEQNNKFINSYEDQRSKIVEKLINAEDKLYNNLDKQLRATEQILKLRQEIEKTYNKDIVDYHEQKRKTGEPLDIKPSKDPQNIQKWTGAKFNTYGSGQADKINSINSFNFENINKGKVSSYVIDKDIESIKEEAKKKEQAYKEYATYMENVEKDVKEKELKLFNANADMVNKKIDIYSKNKKEEAKKKEQAYKEYATYMENVEKKESEKAIWNQKADIVEKRIQPGSVTKFLKDKADNEIWEKKANEVEKNIGKYSKLTNNFTQPVKNIGPSFQSVTTDINLAGNALNMFGQTLKAVGMNALEEAGTWEILRNKLATFTNSAEEAHDRFQEIVKLGLKTPFEVKGLIQAEILLRSFGNNAKDLLPKVIDLASAMGKDVDKAAYAVARAMSGASLGFLMLQKTWGVSYSKLKELGAEFKANGQIVASSVKTQNALRLSLDTLAGSAERLSRTYKGQLSNLQDSIDVLKESAGKTLLPIAKELTDKVIQFVQALNNVPDPVKQFVVSVAGVGGAVALAVGGFSNFVWQTGNLIQGVTAIKSVLPGFIKEFGKIGLVTKGASTGIKAVTAEAQVMGNVMPGLLPSLVALPGMFTGVGSAAVPAAGGVAAFTAALGPILLIGAAVAGTIYLVTKALQAYEKQKQQAKDDELALREINRKTILAELDAKLHDINNSQDVYNKLMNKGAIEIAMIADSEKIFTQALQLQGIEIQNQEKRVEVLTKKWIDAINAKSAYEQGKLEEKEATPWLQKATDVTGKIAEATSIKNIARGIVSVIPTLPGKIYNTGKYIVKGIEDSLSQSKQSPEEIARIKSQEEKIIKDRDKKVKNIKNELSMFEVFPPASKEEELYVKELQHKLDILNDEKYIIQEMDKLNKERVETLKKQTIEQEKILKAQEQQNNLIKYQQQEVANLISAYGPLLPAIQKIIDLQKQKQGIRPEVVTAIIGNLESEKNNLKTDVTSEEEKTYRKYKEKEKAFVTEKGHRPGEIIFEDNEKLTEEERKKLQEEAKKRAQEELDAFNVSMGITNAGKMNPERFEQVKDQLNKRDIIDKNLETYKAFQPADHWASFNKLEKESSKHYIMKDAGEREKYSKSLQEAFDEAFKIDWDKFNAEEEEALGKNEITKKQHLINLEKFINDHGEKLKKYDPNKYAQLWDSYNKEKEKFEKEEYKNSLNMQKDIAKSQDNKKQEIELNKKLELFALQEEYDERVKFAGKTAELDKWYYNQKREIEQKAHEATIKELESEYEERVALIGRAEVASEKLGTFGEKRAKESERYLNEQANADVAYMEQKMALEKQLDGATASEKSRLYQNLNNLDKAYFSESKKRYEEHVLNLKQLAVEELKARTELANTVAEHKHKTGEISDTSYIQEQKASAQAILNQLKDEAMLYERMAAKGQELNEVQKNILSTYQQQEEKLLGLNQLAMEQLISRKSMLDSMVEHGKKMGASTDLDLLNQQKKSTEDILRSTKTLADTYKLRLTSGQQLTETEFNILNTYNQQEEKLKEINTTLEYRLNKEGQIYDIAHKTFEDKLNLAVSEKQITEDVANAQRAVYMEKQIEFEKTKLALLEQKELTEKITDAEREILATMRQRKTEHANLLSSMSGFDDKVRSAVSQAAILSYELKHGADVTGVMSDKFKSAYEYAKSLLEQVKTIGNITAAGNSYGTMGEFSSLEDMIKTQSKFGANKEGAAEWKAKLMMARDTGDKDEADPVKAGRKELEKQRAELQKRLESGRETDAVMKSLEADIKFLDKQLIDGLASQSVQNMEVTATTVNINGEEVGGEGKEKDNEKKGGGGGNPNYKGKTSDTDNNKDDGKDGLYRDLDASKGRFNKSGDSGVSVGGGDSAASSATNPTPSAIAGQPDTWQTDAMGKRIRGDMLINEKTLSGGNTLASRTEKRDGRKDLADTLGIEGIDEENVGKVFGYDNVKNDNSAVKSGKWAVRTINRSITDYTTNFLKGMVRQNMDNLKATNSYTNNYNQNQSKNQRTENNYILNVDGRQTNVSSGPLQKATREVVSLSLAQKTMR